MLVQLQLCACRSAEAPSDAADSDWQPASTTHKANARASSSSGHKLMPNTTGETQRCCELCKVVKDIDTFLVVYGQNSGKQWCLSCKQLRMAGCDSLPAHTGTIPCHTPQHLGLHQCALQRMQSTLKIAALLSSHASAASVPDSVRHAVVL